MSGKFYVRVLNLNHHETYRKLNKNMCLPFSNIRLPIFKQCSILNNKIIFPTFSIDRMDAVVKCSKYGAL